MRILEVSNHSLLGMTHTEAVRVLRAVGDTLLMLVCDGFDPGNAATIEVSWTEGRGSIEENVMPGWADGRWINRCKKCLCRGNHGY